jgi:hypothetical protein
VNPNSPAIDAGGLAGLAEDFDGDARPLDGDGDLAAAEDIGADEYLAGTFTELQVLTPNGGERVASGSTYTVTWGAPAGADHFSVAVSYDGGRRWFTLAGNVTGTWYSWAVPTPVANRTRCRVRVRAYDAGGLLLGADRSDRTFTIEVVRLVTPNGGEVVIGGSAYPVTWETNATAATVTATRIQRSFDGGATWRTVTVLGGNPGAYTWVVPDPGRVRAEARLRVQLLAGTRRVGSDASDLVFYVRPSLVP